ncbi:hypothetical protein UK14_12915 [Streptomyces sp. NRRL F-4428]|nr:hypothetical protein UK14_12915 [Streptomyces sp. NRRL F-4428]
MRSRRTAGSGGGRPPAPLCGRSPLGRRPQPLPLARRRRLRPLPAAAQIVFGCPAGRPSGPTSARPRRVPSATIPRGRERFGAEVRRVPATASLSLSSPAAGRVAPRHDGAGPAAGLPRRSRGGAPPAPHGTCMPSRIGCVIRQPLTGRRRPAPSWRPGAGSMRTRALHGPPAPWLPCTRW